MKIGRRRRRGARRGRPRGARGARRRPDSHSSLAADRAAFPRGGRSALPRSHDGEAGNQVEGGHLHALALRAERDERPRQGHAPQGGALLQVGERVLLCPPPIARWRRGVASRACALVRRLERRSALMPRHATRARARTLRLPAAHPATARPARSSASPRSGAASPSTRSATTAPTSRRRRSCTTGTETLSSSVLLVL